MNTAALKGAEIQLSSAGDEEFFKTYVLPKAERFARIDGLPFGGGIHTNEFKKWKFLRRDDTHERVVGTIYFTNRIELTSFIRRTNCVVTLFRNAKINPGAIAGRDDPTEAKFISKQRDLFTEKSALEFATRFFEAAGHDPKNFWLYRKWHIAWGDPKDKTNYFPLPFYEFEWLRKDVEKVELGEVHHPQVVIMVSGLDQQILSYQRRNLPICGDFDDCSKKTGNAHPKFYPKPVRPDPMSRYFGTK
ncbi:MAG: hypothetical protein ACR2H1_14660 [Limisphaerales bacterium]